jgi:hypothetical protein
MREDIFGNDGDTTIFQSVTTNTTGYKRDIKAKNDIYVNAFFIIYCYAISLGGVIV